MIDNALSLSTLNAHEPTRFTKQLSDQFIVSNLSEEDMLKAAIERYQE
ncbi:hypothetical protein [Lacrimispora sphenoides]|nr:hypothetical protein [Lacrimispora sphenoides]